MAKKLTYRDRKKLLEAHQSGLSNSDLKGRFGIKDERTLKRHLQLGEHEQEARLVRVEIVKDALAGHYAEIRTLIERWKGALSAPQIHEIWPGTRSPTQDIDADPLFGSLKEHLPFPTLWRSYSTWANRVVEYVESCQRLDETIRAKVEGWEGVKEVELHVARPIIDQISNKALGNKPRAHKFDTSFLAGSNDEYLIVDYKDNVLLARDTLPYRELYQALSTQVVASKTATKLIALFKELKALEHQIDDSLQEIWLRRDHIMYTCKLCPGQARLSR